MNKKNNYEDKIIVYTYYFVLNFNLNKIKELI